MWSQIKLSVWLTSEALLGLKGDCCCLSGCVVCSLPRMAWEPIVRRTRTRPSTNYRLLFISDRLCCARVGIRPDLSTWSHASVVLGSRAEDGVARRAEDIPAQLVGAGVYVGELLRGGEAMECRRTDHGCIIGAERRRWHPDGDGAALG